MVNKLESFLSTHPDTKFIIGMYLEAWEEVYGDDFIIDVAETDVEAREQYEFYTGVKGFKFLDENRFGQDFETLGIVSCFKVPKE